MAKTIIQTIGPLYGEAVNGTVFGRPNGSIYVPPTNTIEFTTEADKFQFNTGSKRVGISAKWGYVAQAQDVASYVQIQIYSDEECTTLLMSSSLPAGSFNGSNIDYIGAAPASDTFDNGETYYFRAQLIASTSEPIATSSPVYPLECVI